MNVKNSLLNYLKSFFFCFLLLSPSFSSALCECFKSPVVSIQQTLHACCHDLGVTTKENQNNSKQEKCDCINKENPFEAEVYSQYFLLQTVQLEKVKLFIPLAGFLKQFEPAPLKFLNHQDHFDKSIIVKNTTLYSFNQALLI